MIGGIKATATGGILLGRVLVVHDAHNYTSAVAITDILESVSPLSLPNPDNRDRFTILWDESFDIIGQSTTFVSGEEGKHFTCELDLKKYYTLYKASSLSGTTVNTQKGAIFAVWMSDGLATAPSLNLNIICSWVDVRDHDVPLALRHSAYIE